MKHRYSLFLTRACALFFVFLLGITSVLAQAPGNLDLSFNPTDAGYDIPYGTNGAVLASAIQTDGKIIIAGTFTTSKGHPRNRIERLNPDGSSDASFNIGTGFSGNAQINLVAIQPDGKILVGGIFSIYNGTPCSNVIRLNADGSLDPGFTIETANVNYTLSALAIRPDGKVVLVGGIVYNGNTLKRTVVLNADGTRDTGFTGTGFASSSGQVSVKALTIQPDNKIVVTGNFNSYNGTSRNHVLRLLTNGTLDLSFTTGNALSSAGVIKMTSGNQFLLAGSVTTSGGTADQKILRLSANGSLDAGFSTGTGTAASGTQIRDFTEQPDGKILVGGDFQSYNGQPHQNIVRLLSDGSVDTGFMAAMTGSVYSIQNVTGNRVLLAGAFTEVNALSRLSTAFLLSDGSNEGGPYVLTGITGVKSNEGFTSLGIHCSRVLPDGKVLIGGFFNKYNGVARKSLARINADGTLDASFNPGSGPEIPGNPLVGRVSVIALQADGKILIGGMFSHYNGVARNNIARLHPDGTLDSSFTIGSGFEDPFESGGWGPGFINSLIILPDGKIVAGGMFTHYNGVINNQIARLNPDGSLDTTFQVGEGLNYYGIWGLEVGFVEEMALQPDGKILIGGLIQSYNNVIQNGIVRINPDGSLDTGFSGTATNQSWVRSLALQPDGKVLIGGTFRYYNGISQNRIARLNADGTLDASFAAGTGIGSDVNTSINTIALQSDGKVLIGGSFSTYNGISTPRIARLNNDGSLDSSFIIGSGTNASINSIILQPDGNVVIGGEFTAYNGTGRNRLARLFGSTPVTPPATLNTGPLASAVLMRDSTVSVPFMATGTFDSLNVFTVQLSDAAGSFVSPVTIRSQAGTASGSISALIPTGQAPGSAYRIRVVASAPYTIGTDNGSDLSLVLPPAPVIVTDSLTGLVLTRGAIVAVPFTVSGTFNGANVFTAELSDAAGSFASPDTIGMLAGTHSDTIIAVIAAAQAAGTQYRIRVVASAPAITGADNGLDLSLILPPAAPGMISGKMSSVCSGTVESYSIAPVPGASSYTWTVPADADLLSGQGTRTISVHFITGFVAGKLTVAAENAAGSSAMRSLSVSSVLPTPGAISGPTTEVCAGSSENYSIAPVSGASSYFWKVPTGASIISGQGSTNVTVAFTTAFEGGNLSVAAVNACGEGSFRARSVRSSTVIPGAISGVRMSVCPGTVESYSIAPVPGASSYHWTAPSGADILSGQGTTAVTVSFSAAFVSGNINVNAHNPCGASAARALGLRSTPVPPGAITGAATVCRNQANVTYSIAAVAGATSYTWAVPSGATIVSGQGTTSVTLSYGATTGALSLSVKASNGCGLSAARTLGVTVNSCVREMDANEEEPAAFEVYPNPSRGQFQISYIVSENGSAQLLLFDVTGRAVKQQSLPATKGSNNYDVEAAALPKGVYLMELITDHQIQRQRVVIE